MAISWNSVKAALFFFGPMLLPKAIAFVAAQRRAPTAQGLTIKPVPTAVSRALALLFLTALVLLTLTLPPFAPENIFSVTQSRLQIPTDVLFTRLASLRAAQGGLTPADHRLRAKISSLESRLLYLQHGPSVMADCAFCSLEEAQSFLYYSLPAILAPHLANTVVLAVATSGVATGADGARWRRAATLCAVAVAGLDLYGVGSFDHQANARALRLADADMFHWSARVYRLVALAALDALVGWLLYLSSTKRAFAEGGPPPADRVAAAARLLETIRSRMSAAGIVRNTVVRDEALRERSQAYWSHEKQLMGQVMEERDVVEGVNNALRERIDVERISRDAETYAQSIMGDGIGPQL